MQIIEVRWVDSSDYPEQTTIHENFHLSEMHTVGWLISENDKQIVVARTIVGDDVRAVIVIPKVCIVKRREINGG